MTEPTCAHAPTATSPLRVQFWGCGVFAVRDGRLTLWRDYFDFVNMVKAITAIKTMVRTVAATAVPALRPSLTAATVLLRPPFYCGHRFEEGAART